MSSPVRAVTSPDPAHRRREPGFRGGRRQRPIRLREPFVVDEIEIQVSASIGIGLYPVDGDDAEALLKHADAAMYSVKGTGRDGYARYGDGAATARRRPDGLFSASNAVGEPKLPHERIVYAARSSTGSTSGACSSSSRR